MLKVMTETQLKALSQEALIKMILSETESQQRVVKSIEERKTELNKSLSEGKIQKNSYESQISKTEKFMKVLKGETLSENTSAKKASTPEELDERVKESVREVKKLQTQLESLNKESDVKWYTVRDKIRSHQSRISVSMKGWEKMTGKKHPNRTK